MRRVGLGKRVALSNDALRAKRRNKLVDGREVRGVLKRMDTTPFMIDVLANSNFYIEAFMDSGCLCFSAFSSQLVHNRRLPRIGIEARLLKLAEKDGDNDRRKISHIMSGYSDNAISSGNITPHITPLN